MKQEAAKKSVWSKDSNMTNQQPNNNGAGNAKREHLVAVNDNPIPFKGVIKTAFTSTTELAHQVNKFMGTIFDDYYGSNIFVDQTGNLSMSLIFKPVQAIGGKEDHRAFAPITEQQVKSENTIVNTMFAVNAMQKRNSNFGLTQYASELLYDMIAPAIANGKRIDPFNPNTYKQIIAETVDNTPMGGSIIYCSVDCIDLVRVLGKLYGVKDVTDNSQMLYQIVPLRPLNYSTAGQATNWLLAIYNMSRASFENTITKLGAVPNTGSIIAVTGTGE